MGNHACLHPLSWQPDISQRFACLQREPGAILLDSGQPASLGGRFDIASAWPLQQIQPQDREPPEHFLHRARQLLQQLPAIHSHAANTDDLPFTGGLIGYLGYHFGQPDSRHPRQLPDACIGLYDWALINDHHRQHSWLFCHPAMPDARRQQLLQLFQAPCIPAAEPPFELLDHFRPLIDPQEYRHAIGQVHRAIEHGQCRQINYTQRFSSSYRGNPWYAWRSLRAECPVPYAAFVRLDEQNAILSASPERFLAVNAGVVEARPIKGTRRRGLTAEEDRRLANELLASAKDRAENLMIVELQKKEFAPLCHDIHTPQLAVLESYPNVHHLVSCVRARLDPGRDALDLLLHCFPCASISGTPRQPAQQLIDRLEACSREIYCGSIFHLDGRGEFDSSVCIRTLLARDGAIHCWGGGGITRESVWQDEYRESVDKIRVLMDVLQRKYGQVSPLPAD